MQAAILPFLQNQLHKCDSSEVVAASSGRASKKKASPTKRKDPPTETAANNLHFDEFKDVVKHHFKLKKQVIQKQLYNWLQEDKLLEHLCSEQWSLWDQLEHHWNTHAVANWKGKS